jgi:hypothetical protein
MKAVANAVPDDLRHLSLVDAHAAMLNLAMRTLPFATRRGVRHEPNRRVP